METEIIVAIVSALAIIIAAIITVVFKKRPNKTPTVRHLDNMENSGTFTAGRDINIVNGDQINTRNHE